MITLLWIPTGQVKLQIPVVEKLNLKVKFVEVTEQCILVWIRNVHVGSTSATENLITLLYLCLDFIHIQGRAKGIGQGRGTIGPFTFKDPNSGFLHTRI